MTPKIRGVLATLAAAAVVGGCGGQKHAVVVGIATFPWANGPGPVVAARARTSGVYVKLADVKHALPSTLPKNPAQTCAFGPTVLITFANGETMTYGPCELPRAIELLRRVLVRTAQRDYPSLSKPAHAITPEEWKAVLNDWYDGRMDLWHSCAAVRDAMKHLPVDSPVYSSARDDLLSYERAVC
jgi:hypothetical protein